MAGGQNGPPVLNGAAYIYASKTLAQLRDDLLCMLGFPDPLTDVDLETKTLVDLREELFRRSGNRYAVGANPPDVDRQYTIFINEAQQTIFRWAELDKAGVAFPAEMIADSDPTELDYVPVLTLATAHMKAHLGQQDATVYFKEVEKYMGDRALRRPPNVVAMCNKWLERAQFQMYHKYSILRTERWWKIPIVQGQRIYDVPSIASDPLTDVAFVDSNPDTITRLAGSWITDGFKVGMKIKALGATDPGNNNTQWTIDGLSALTITLSATDAVVAEGAGASIIISTVNNISLDFRKVSEAWLDDDGRWLTLTGGIPTGLFNISQQTLPYRYEMREFFEIFPEPDKTYTAWIKGHMGLMEFTADSDITTIDPETILMQAIVWGKAHFQQKDALLVREDLKDLVGNLNSGLFAGMRYIPNPDMEARNLPYPEVTGTGWSRP